jgi:hypothetical protein
MNMFLKALDADPACASYKQADAGPSPLSDTQPGLSCQAYMNDLALFSSDALSAACDTLSVLPVLWSHSCGLQLQAYHVTMSAWQARASLQPSVTLWVWPLVSRRRVTDHVSD